MSSPINISDLTRQVTNTISPTETIYHQEVKREEDTAHNKCSDPSEVDDDDNDDDNQSEMSSDTVTINLVTDVGPQDVLCGRGGKINNHPGNCEFRELIKSQQEVYLKAKKRVKPNLTASIIESIRSRKGRFLKKDDATGGYYEISDTKAREKVAQALREGAPRIRKKRSKLALSKIYGSNSSLLVSQNDNVAKDIYFASNLSNKVELDWKNNAIFQNKINDEQNDSNVIDMENDYSQATMVIIHRALPYRMHRNLQRKIEYEKLSEKDKLLYRLFQPP